MYLNFSLIRKNYSSLINQIKNEISLRKIKLECENKRRLYKLQKQAVHTIQEYKIFYKFIKRFWKEIIEQRENKTIKEKINSLPKDCQELYKKFKNLRKQTKFLKNKLHGVQFN